MSQYKIDIFAESHRSKYKKEEINNETIYTKKFGMILYNLRYDKRMNQEQLANALGVDRTTISNYENGKRQPTFEMVCEIARYFEVSTEYFVDGSEFLGVTADRGVLEISPKAKEKINNMTKRMERKRTLEILISDKDFSVLIEQIFTSCMYASKIPRSKMEKIKGTNMYENIFKISIFNENLPFGAYFREVKNPSSGETYPSSYDGSKEEEDPSSYNDCAIVHADSLFRMAAHSTLDRIMDRIKNNSYFKNQLIELIGNAYKDKGFFEPNVEIHDINAEMREMCGDDIFDNPVDE